jgi:hypothetical protein
MSFDEANEHDEWRNAMEEEYDHMLPFMNLSFTLLGFVLARR